MLFTVQETGKYLINISFQQLGVPGDDSVSLIVNNNIIPLVVTEMSIEHTISNCLFLKLSKNDKVYLKTTLSEIKMSDVGLISRFHLYK